MEYQDVIAQRYLGEQADIFDQAQMNQLMEEVSAYICGAIHEGTHVSEIRSFSRNYDAVKSAWDTLVETMQEHMSGQAGNAGLGTVEDAPADVARLYQQLLEKANKAKRIEALEQYYRKYVGEASGEGTESETSAAFPELERAYREAMGTERYDDETFRELKRLCEEYVGNPMEKPEDEERDPDWP